MIREVAIGENVFVIGQLPPKTAFHIARRLAPFIGALRKLLPYALSERRFDAEQLEDIVDIVEPVAGILAEMRDEEANYILDHCLGVVQVRLPEGRGLAPLMVGGTLMYENLSMPTMVRLTWEVIQANLAGFMPAGASAS